MSVHTHLADNAQKILVTFEDRNSVLQLLGDFKRITKDSVSHDGQVDIIWDFSAAHPSDLSFDVIEQISQIILSDDNIQFKNGKSAYVIDERIEKHLLNYLLDCLTSGGYKREVRLFHSLKQAQQFLSFS